MLPCREPHVESALVYGVRPGGLLVFVPRFHLRGAVRLADRNGLVIPPLTGAPGEAADAEGERYAFALAARRELDLQTGTHQRHASLQGSCAG